MYLCRNGEESQLEDYVQRHHSNYTVFEASWIAEQELDVTRVHEIQHQGPRPGHVHEKIDSLPFFLKYEALSVCLLFL